MNLSEVADLNRVVIIDNSEEDGGAIHDALQKQMIGSVFLHVNGLNGLPNKPFPNVSLVFLDLDLISSIANSRDKASRAVACLSRVVPPNSFYVLVIWSTHTTTELETEFRDILSNTDIIPCVSPIAVSKIDCRKSNGDYSVSKINTRIRERFSSLKAQSLFLEWSTIVSGQISNFTSDITTGDDQRNLSKKIHALAEAYGGSTYKDDLSRNALFTLNEALKGSIDGAVARSSKLDGYHNNGRIYSNVAKVSDSQKSLINTHLMVDPHTRLGPGCAFMCENTACPFHEITTGSAGRNAKKVLIDLTPVCDAAQKKNKLNHYIHGMLIPTENIHKLNSSGYIYKFQNQFQFKGKSYFLVVNLKSLEGTLKRKFPGIDETITMKTQSGESVNVINKALNTDIVDNVLLKFRDPVVLDVQQKTAAYMSRFGHAYLS